MCSVATLIMPTWRIALYEDYKYEVATTTNVKSLRQLAKEICGSYLTIDRFFLLSVDLTFSSPPT